MFRTIERYEETGLGLPYPIVLIDGAEEELDDETGEVVGISIPDLEGLVKTVTLTRIMNPLQLDGSEVKFIRRAMGLSAKDLAADLTIDPATFSRWENGKYAPGEWADKQVRMFAILLLKDSVPDCIEPADLVGLRVRRRDATGWPCMELRRVRRQAADSRDTCGWDTLKMAA